MNKKRIAFSFIALLIPVLCLILIEFTLRFVGYGRSLPLFIENPAHSEYLLPRPDILARYFPDGQVPRVTMETNFFLKEKPTNGFRLVVQGGSTAAGFPYGYGASLAGMLEKRLRVTYPDKNVEVISTAMSAVNSYLLNELTDEIIDIQPDAILIYAGHNEFLGIFGAGSSFQFGGQWLTRLYLNVSHLAIVDALQTLLRPVSDLPDAEQSRSRTFMSQVAKDTHIPLDSDKYQQGVEQFSGNLATLLSKYQRAGIPVFISTLASNERSLTPFISNSSSERQNANAEFKKGMMLLSEGRNDQARIAFQAARDKDLLRFRAPSEFNAIITSMASKYNAVLVEGEQRLREKSLYQIIGEEMMLEHVHPTLPGYFLLSDAFYQAIAKTFRQFNPETVSIDDAWKMRSVLPAEEYYGFAQVQALKADFPFRQEPAPINLPKPANWQQQLGKDYFEKSRDWLDVVTTSYQRYEKAGNQAQATKALGILADALPHNAMYNEQIGDTYMLKREYALASHYYERAKRAGAVSELLDKRIEWLKAKLLK